MEENIKILFDNLTSQKLYTKSYDEFVNQFSTPENISLLYKTLSDRKLYTKSESEFNSQFFSVKKKDETIPVPSQPSANPLETSSASESPSPSQDTVKIDKATLLSGEPVIDKQVFKNYLKSKVSDSTLNVNDIVDTYYNEAKSHNIRPDVALTQALLETDAFKNTDSKIFNFAGIAHYDNAKNGRAFSSLDQGVKAHVQLLKKFVAGNESVDNSVDVSPSAFAKAKNVGELAGSWATDEKYGDKLVSLFNTIADSGKPISTTVQESAPMDFFPELNTKLELTNTALGKSAFSPVDTEADRWHELFPMVEPLDEDKKEYIRAKGEQMAYEKQLMETPAGTLRDFTQKYGVSARDLGYKGEVNLDRQMSQYEEDKFKRIIQTKFRIDVEQNPDKYKGGMFGSDVTKESYGLGFIKTVATGVGAELINTFASAGETIGDWLGFEKNKGYLRAVESNIQYVAKTLPDLPNTVAGKTVGGGVHLSEFLIELSMTPSIKLFNASKLPKGIETLSKLGFINKEGAVVVPKLLTQMSGRNFAQAYAESLDDEMRKPFKPLFEGLKSAGVGAMEASVLMTLGYGSSAFADLFKSTKGQLIAGSAAEGFGFGTYSAVNQLVSTGDFDPKQLGADFVLGAGLHASHYTGRQQPLADAVADRATLRYFSATPETIAEARLHPKSPEALRQEALDLRQQDISDPAVRAYNNTKADALDGIADIKAVDKIVSEQPKVFQDKISKDKSLDDNQKTILNQRIDDAVSANKIENVDEKPAEEEKPVPKEEQKPSIVSEENGEQVRFVVRESDDKFSVDLRDQVTDKAMVQKSKELENAANEKLAQRRTEIIKDIQKADKDAKKEVFVEYENERYKVTDKGEVVSYTKRNNGRPARVTNKTLKEAVLKKYAEDSSKLSDVQMKVYDEEISKVKQELKDEIDSSLRAYRNERRTVVLKESDKPTFSEQPPIESKPGDTATGAKDQSIPKQTEVIDKWEQFKKELKIQETASKKGAKAQKEESERRVENLHNILNTPKELREQLKKEAKDKGFDPKSVEYRSYIKEQMAKRNLFEGIPDNVYLNMVRKATDAFGSDAKLRQAVEYIDKALGDNAFAKHEAERLGIVDDISKAVAPKALLQKGSRGGSPKAKKKFLEYGGDDKAIKELQTINELITEGKTKDIPDPAKKAYDNFFEIEKLEMERDSKIESDNLSEERKNQIEKKIAQLQRENLILEYADVHNREIYRLKELRDEVERIRDGKQTRAEEVRAKLKETYSKLANDVIADIKPKYTKTNKKTGNEIPISSPPKNSRVFLWNTNFWSLIHNVILRKSNYRSGKLPVFDNRLTEQYAPLVTASLNLKAQRALDQHQEWIDGLEQIYPEAKTNGQKKRLITDLNTNARITIELDKDVLDIAPSQAIEKILQWRSADGRRSMEKMGFTQKVVDKMLVDLKPQEVQLMDFLVKLMNKYSDIYDQAYIKENGVSMKTVSDFYWTLHKLKETPTKEQIGENFIDATIRKNRTIARTKDASPLNYGSAINDLFEFANEAIHYEAWAGTLRELQYIFKDPNVRRAIRFTSGSGVVTQMDNNLKSFAGNLQAENVRFLDQASGLYASATLGMKVTPVINQVGASIYYLADMMNPKSFGEAVMRSMSFKQEDVALRRFLKGDIFVRERKATSSVALGREIETIGTQVMQYGSNPKMTKLLSRFPSTEIQEMSGMGLREGDLVPVVGIGSGYVRYKYKQYSGKDLSLQTIQDAQSGKMDANFDKALQDWRFFSEVTQQSLRATNRSAFSQVGTWGRTFSLFTSGPLSAQRVFNAYATDFARATRIKDKEAMGKALHGMVTMHILGGATFGLIDGLLSASDDKHILKSVTVGMAKGNLEGLALFGRIVSMVSSAITDKPWGKNYQIPLMPVMRNFENIARYGAEVYKLETSSVKNEQHLVDAYGKLFTSLSVFSGLPVQGTVRLWNGSTETGKDIKESFRTVGFMETVKHLPLSLETIGISKQDDPYYRPEGNIGVYKSPTEAVDDAKRYMTFQVGDVTKTLDKVRENDKYGKLEIDKEGLYDMIKRAAGSGFKPKDILIRAFNDISRDRLKDLYGVGKDLNTPEEVRKVLKDNPLMSDSDNEYLNDMLENWGEFQYDEEKADAEETLEDLLEKSYDITEKALVQK